MDYTGVLFDVAEYGKGLVSVGKLATKSSDKIASSKINIGCECLDRQMWYLDKSIDHLGLTGVKHARIQSGWSLCEKVKGEYDFSWLDEVIDSMLAKGIQPWLNLTYGNIHYCGSPTEDSVGWAPCYSIEAMHGWRRYVKAVVAHCRDRIFEYEIWNEPDIAPFWKHDKADPIKYAQMVIDTSRQIKDVQPDAFIIGAATAGGTGSRGLMYLEYCLRAGMGEHIDAISYHCYRPRPEGQSLRELDSLRAQLKRHGLDLKIWQGECGCPSEKPENEAMCGMPWDEAKQAKWMLRRMISDLDMDLDMTTHFHLSDFHNYYKDGLVDIPAFFGLLRNKTYECKPSYYTFQSLCTLFDDCTAVDRELQVTVDVSSPEAEGKVFIDWLLVRTSTFERNGYPLLAYWYPAELNPEINPVKPFAPGSITLTISHLRKLRIKEPVLIDPVKQIVYKIPATADKATCGVEQNEWGFSEGIDTDGQMVINNLPLLDYPLLLTDLAACDIEMAH